MRGSRQSQPPARAKMVSLIAKKISKNRQHKALSELFDRADVTKDGSISITEYIAICDEHGIEIDETDRESFLSYADETGEVNKNDFIILIKNSNLSKDFETADPQSDFHWKKKADLAFRLFDKDHDGYINKKEFQYMTSSKNFNKKKIERVFQICDENGDGKLDYKEFTGILFRQRARLEEQTRLEESLLTDEERMKRARAKELAEEKKNKVRKIKIRCK